MKPSDIQVGKIYINNGKGRTARKVLAIGLEHRPEGLPRYWGTHKEEGVLYEQYIGKGDRIRKIRRNLYITSFAKWAGREA